MFSSVGLFAVMIHVTELLRRRKKFPDARTAPGPRGTMLLGSLQAFQDDSLGFMARSVRAHGDIVRFRLGPVVVHLVNRPEYVEHVLAHAARRYDKQTRSVSKIRATCGESLLSSDGESWLRHRRLIQPFFQKQYLRSFAPTIDAAIEEMLGRWAVSARRGQELNMVSEMMAVTMTIAARILFASDIRSDTHVIERALDAILDDTWRRLESPLDLSVLSPRLHRPAFKRAVAEIDRVVYRLIAERRRSAATADDLLSSLLRSLDTQEGAGLTDRELRDAAVTLLLAGHETTANALAWSFYLIAQAPSVENRLRAEARNAAAAETSPERPEAWRVFCEAIRLYPSIWIMERRVVQDDQIAGFVIPRRSTVVICPYLLHRHPEYWSNPEAFDPSRFAPQHTTDRPGSAYIPFGLGPHRCIGEPLASLVATRVLSAVYREFGPRLVAEQDAVTLPGITLRHRHPLRMTVEHFEPPQKATDVPTETQR